MKEDPHLEWSPQCQRVLFKRERDLAFFTHGINSTMYLQIWKTAQNLVTDQTEAVSQVAESLLLTHHSPQMVALTSLQIKAAR